MVAASGRRGFTIVELIVVILLIGILIAMLPPTMGVSREAARRANCLNNLKQLGLGFQTHQATLEHLPPSCDVFRNEKGDIVADDGWSWGTYLLPYTERLSLWEYMNKEGRPLDAANRSALHAATLDYHCPNFGDDICTKTGEVVSNYKAFGATHIESLGVASPRPTVPKYNPTGAHPDGGIFPGSTHGMNEITDGTAHTFLLAETVEPTFARWTVGREMTMVGLPRTIEFEKVDHYWAPAGFTPKRFWADTTVSPNDVYLRWDYDKNPYDGGDGSQGGKFGPGSYHPRVTNHLLADGSVKSVGKAIDAAAYMFLITRCAGDPRGPSEP
jgi:prepilin-type N-terminal cleavage/methylation domain-containing protein